MLSMLGHLKIKPACLCKIYIAVSHMRNFPSTLAQHTGTGMSVVYEAGHVERKAT